jgi:hypothetical protein
MLNISEQNTVIKEQSLSESIRKARLTSHSY